MDRTTDADMAAQFERIIRRVKASMSYRGSYSTRDILGALVARWVHSGEWQRLRALPPAERHIGPSVRRFILDRLEQVRGRGEPVEVDALALPSDDDLVEQVETAELHVWLADRVAELQRGEVDARMRIPLAHPIEVGEVLARALRGFTQRRIAVELDIALGLVNRRIAEGTSYLVVLRGIEEGIEGILGEEAMS
ncbi:MAG: hypothetical protein KF773_35660 [Deltaproteobacteria bacterium]|nr:hypothetical protein [Deltaproteobacteria bacterium]MCW5809238.1 hypothetical protein [Deltaproteobacteria bacterium]